MLTVVCVWLMLKYLSICRRYNHLLRSKTMQRKYAYYGKQNHLLLARDSLITTPTVQEPSTNTVPSVPIPTCTVATTTATNDFTVNTTSFYNKSHTERRDSNVSLVSPAREEHSTKSRSKRSKRSSHHRSSVVVEREKSPTVVLTNHVPVDGYTTTNHIDYGDTWTPESSSSVTGIQQLKVVSPLPCRLSVCLCLPVCLCVSVGRILTSSLLYIFCPYKDIVPPIYM